MKPLKLLAISLALFTGWTPLHAADAPLLSADSVIGTVGGKAVQLSDIETKKINELRIELHDALQEAYIQHAVKQLADRSADYTLPPPVEVTDAQVETFYQNNNLQNRGSLEQLAPMIRKYMQGMGDARNHIAIYQQAVGKGDITSRLAKPEEILLQLPVESAHIRGNDQAGVMVMEFSDYQCPYCKRTQPTIQALIQEYGDRVAFGYRHYPLAFHQEADDASLAIECARDQGKFEQMHEIFFNQPNNLSRPELKKIARQVELADPEQFDRCLDDNTYADRLARDMQVAESVGITGTPGFIVGYHDPDKGTLEGELISGAQPASVFVSTIEKYLKGR